MEILRFRLEHSDYMAEVQRLDQSRRSIHNAFISRLKVVNRICESHGFAPLYQGSDNRYDQGDLAFQIVNEFSGNRLRDVITDES